MASFIKKADTKGKASDNEGTQQTLTLTFVPEIEHYKRPKNMEEHIRTYFENINGINKRIIAEERKLISQNRNTWPTLPVEERDRLLNDQLVAGGIRKKYNSDEDYWNKKTQWKADELLAPIDKQKICEERTGNDSFSSPFQWRTKSQRNIRFPEIKKHREKHCDVQETQEKVKPLDKVAAKQDKQYDAVKETEQTDKKNYNVDKNVKENQVQTKNDHIKGSVKESNTISPVSNKHIDVDQEPKTSTYNTDVENRDELSSEQPNVDEKKYLDGSENIFEFLQSWNP